MIKVLIFSFSFVFIGFFSTSIPVFAETTYESLAPIEGINNAQGKIDINKDTLENYFRTIYRMGIAIATGLAVLMIVLGGIEYITTDAIGGKEEGKEKISNAIMGLLLALGSYIILRTIDPNLVNVKFDIKEVDQKALQELTAQAGEFKFPGDEGYPYQPGSANYGSVVGPNGQIIPASALKGTQLSVRFTYFSSDEKNNDGRAPGTNGPDDPGSGTRGGFGAYGKLVSNDNFNPSIVGSAGSSYYPGGTVFARNVEGRIFYTVVDDNNIKNGKPYNTLIAVPNAFDIYTSVPEKDWNTKLKNLQNNQPVTIVYIPGTVANWAAGIAPKSYLTSSQINAMHDINVLMSRINSVK